MTSTFVPRSVKCTEEVSLELAAVDNNKANNVAVVGAFPQSPIKGDIALSKQQNPGRIT